MTALKKHDETGHMAFYQGQITSPEKSINHVGVVRAFKAAAQKIAGAEVIPTTVGLSGLPKGTVGFEFAVTSDVSEAQSKKIVAAVKKQTGTTLKLFRV